MLGRRGGANFLLKCHGLCPICLTFLIVHFFTYIYYILNLCSVHTNWMSWMYLAQFPRLPFCRLIYIHYTTSSCMSKQFDDLRVERFALSCPVPEHSVHPAPFHGTGQLDASILHTGGWRLIQYGGQRYSNQWGPKDLKYVRIIRRLDSRATSLGACAKLPPSEADSSDEKW